MEPLLLVRRVPPARLAVTRQTAATWQQTLNGVDWWELVDPVCEDEHPAAALAAVEWAGTTARLVALAAPPGRRDLAVQVLLGLVDALRAGPARALVATRHTPGAALLLEAGFRPHEEDTWNLEL